LHESRGAVEDVGPNVDAAVRTHAHPSRHDDAVVSSRPTVLLLSDDPMTLALVGMLLELANVVPAFAAAGERPEDALARVRPVLVVLVDDMLDAARSDMFFARAAQRRVALAVFPGKTSRGDLRNAIGERGIPWLDLPTDVASLARVIQSAAATRWWTRGADRRALPAAERADDGGGLYFVDRSGRRWRVYDRRGSERRQNPEGGDPAALPNAPIAASPREGVISPADLTRIFVGDDGRLVETPLADGEAASVSALDLEQQFLRALPVG
jgi:hypothetical protein